jgi:hypothetical protein
MSDYYIICSKCRKLFSINEKKCPACETPVAGNETGFPPMLSISMECKKPENEIFEKLMKEPFKKTGPSEGEAKSARNKILIGIGILLFGVLFGMWVINTFRGFGVIVFGYGSLIAGPIGFIVFLKEGVKLLTRDGRKKSVKESFIWLWAESYYGEIFSKGKRSVEYSCACAKRCIPESLARTIDDAIHVKYVRDIQKQLDFLFSGMLQKIDYSCNLNTVENISTEWKFETEINIENEKEIVTGLKEVTGIVKLKKILNYFVPGGNTGSSYDINVADVLIKIHGYYIRNGEYFFPYDIMPKIVEKAV